MATSTNPPVRLTWYEMAHRLQVSFLAVMHAAVQLDLPGRLYCGARTWNDAEFAIIKARVFGIPARRAVK